MEHLCSVGGLADVVVPEGDDPAPMIRRIRLFATNGVLPPAAGEAGGTGVHRLFHPKDAYIVAILNQLADFSTPNPVLKDLVDKIRRRGGWEEDQLWHDAIAGKKPVFALIYHHNADATGSSSDAILYLMDGRELLRVLGEIHGAVILNLTTIFSRVRLD